MNHITFNIDPMSVPSIALSFAEQRDLARRYAEAFDADSGDSVTDYIHQAGVDLYPMGKFSNQDRADFRRLLRSELRQLRKLGR